MNSEVMNKDDLVVVTGAGGFIGGHLLSRLRQDGFRKLRAVDVKPLDDWYQVFGDVENIRADLKSPESCTPVARGARYIFSLAADMGGMGFIETHKADCMLSVLISTNMLVAAREQGAQRLFYSSSACVYAAEKQTDAKVVPLREADAYPAMPEDGYGWEKLFSERMCRHFFEDFGLETRVARYHNVYGPYGTYDGGREKAPAAICRKVIQAILSRSNEIEIWGDGEQTRSFMYIDDCLNGTRRIMSSDVREPLNLGSDELVTINQLVDIVESVAGVRLKRRYKLDAPKGVRGRNSDNTRIKAKLGWAPSISLREGMEKTYRWIHGEMTQQQDQRRRYA
jgi:GDP-D-mannose 3',5'-epimerase